MGQDREELRCQEPEVARSAHPLADIGMVADGTGSVQQRGPYMYRGYGRRTRPHTVAAHQRSRRGYRTAYRLLGTYSPQHSDIHTERDKGVQADRPLGRFLLRRDTDQRAGAQGMGAHPGDRETRRYGQSHRDRCAQDAHRGGGCPHSGPHRLGRADHRRHEQVTVFEHGGPPIDIP